MSDKDHPTTEYDDYGSENNYDTGYDDGIESDGYTSEDYESGEYESDDNETGDYASDDYDAEYSDSDSYASDDYDAEDGDPEYYDSEQYAASDYDDAYDQGEYDVESADPATIDPDTIPPEALEPYYDKSAFKWLKNMNRAKLIRLVSMLIFSVAILVFASIAWFTMNRETGASGMSITTATLPFDIATKGTSVRNQSVINAEHPEYVEGTSGTYENQGGTSGTYYISDSLLLRYTPLEDDQDTLDVDESIAPDISPGSSGELSLYVIPKTESQLTMKVSLKVVAFAQIDKYDVSTQENEETGEEETVYTKNGTQIIEITNTADFSNAANAVNNTTAAGEASAYIEAAEYLRGHILFFGGLGATTTASGGSDSETVWEYYYTTPYTSRVINQTIASGNEGKAVQVPVYWMWPNTLGQIALQTNANNLRSGVPVVKESVVESDDGTDTDKELLLSYLTANLSSVFTGTETVTKEMIYQADTLENFEILSRQYNAADYEIGTRIAYFMIEVEVESN